MKMSVKEYSILRNLSRQRIAKLIKEGRTLPNISRVQKIGKTYVLEFDEFVSAKK